MQGGFLNLNLMMDRDVWSSLGVDKGVADEREEVYQVVRGCLSHGRPPPADLAKCPQDSVIEVAYIVHTLCPKKKSLLKFVPF